MDSNNWRVKRDPAELPSRPSNQGSPFGQRRQNGGGDRGGYEKRTSPSSGRFDHGKSRESPRRPINDAKAEKAIEEGRRLYVGNMPYEATLKDVESLFTDLADRIEAINMSIDPMTGRNPSYCFVDFASKDLAQRVMDEYNGVEFLRRPLRVKPGVKSSRGNVGYDARSSQRVDDSPIPFDRWRRTDKPEERIKPMEENRRVYVGGLPRFESNAETTLKMKELFEGFNVEVVSKLVSPAEAAPEKSHFCFVDLGSSREVDEAIKALDGTEKWGRFLKVNHAKGTPKKFGERRRLFIGGLPQFPDQETLEAGIAQLFTNYEVATTSKLFTPRESTEVREGNHCFCFVELMEDAQVDEAMLELDWKEAWGGKVRVKPSVSEKKTADRENRSPRGWGPRNSAQN